MTDLVGREQDLAAIRPEAERAMRRPAVVSITGLGGVEKSSLAIEAAHQLREDFPDGSLYLDCGSQTGQPVPLGRVLQLRGRPDEAREVFLRERDCLVASGVDNLGEIEALIARLDARHGGQAAAM